MAISRDDLLDLCRRQEAAFLADIVGLKFEAKGIFNSEMLLVIALARHFGVQRIIESGRARAQSTEVLARCLPEVEIHSLEFLRWTEDNIAARKRLATYNNVHLHFGDSLRALPELLTTDCLVLIDGPKGIPALRMAAQAMERACVKGVLVHDLHRDAPERSVAESAFPAHFFTDDTEYVTAFQHLDDGCWSHLTTVPAFADWAPYQRGSRHMKSYAATLAFFENHGEKCDLEHLDTPQGQGKSPGERWRAVAWKIRYKCGYWMRAPYWAFREIALTR